MLRLRLNVAPKDGYFFKDGDGSRHSGSSWSGLIKKVIRYRALNRLPPGDPTAEVPAQACARSPEICYNDDPVTRVQTIRASLKGRVLAWFSALRQLKKAGPLLFTDGGVMTARLNICAGCPHNIQLPGGCSSCVKVVKTFRTEILGDRGQDSRGHGCGILGNDIQTAAWLDEPPLDNPALPEFCWRRRK